ncbi:transposase, IS4 family protein [Rhodococcus wratislaviensis IFP 2016]|nr:transposase, IS4 family protein [Rhodococcus wratislaviensis IFP 2016]
MRKVRTASGAVAVQVVRKPRGQWEIVAHVGSAHTDAELGVLLEQARRLARGGQAMLDLDVPEPTSLVADVAVWQSGQLSTPTRKSGGSAMSGRTVRTSARLLYRRSRVSPGAAVTTTVGPSGHW